MIDDVVESYPKSNAMLLKDYHDQAIQCCINSWNQLCPSYPLAKVTEVTKQKRLGLFGSDVAFIVKSGNGEEISRIVFEINNRLTARAFRKHHESLLVIVDFRIWWNYDGYLVRGWLNHIMVDVVNNCVVNFPQITPTSPYWENII